MIVEVAAVVPVSRADAFAFLVDCANDPKWRQSIASAQLMRGKPGSIGARYRVEALIMGQSMDMEASVVEVDGDERFALAVEGPQGDMVTVTRLVGSGNETTVTVSTDLSSLGPMAKMAAGVIRSQAETDLSALVELLSGPDGHTVTSTVTSTVTDAPVHTVPSPTASAPPRRAPGAPRPASPDHGWRRGPGEKSLYDIARELEPVIREHEAAMEANGRIPAELADALYRAGVFTTFTPRELGGLQVDPVEWLEMVEELSRISGAVGWLAMVNSGAVMIPRERWYDLTDNGKIPWIAAGNFGRQAGVAKRVEGGYIVNGRWPFTSGSPHANFLGGAAILHDDDDQVVVAPDGLPWSITAVFARDEVTVLDNWDGLGVRGSGSGEIEVVDGFVPAYVADRSMLDLVFNEMLFREMAFVLTAHTAHAIGLAQAAIDEYIEMCNRKKADGSRRQAEMGRQQIHRVNVARADALVRSSRLFARDAVQQVWDEMHARDEGVASMETRVIMMESIAFVVEQCREAVDLIFRSAGVGGVHRGTRLERIFRDTMTVAQHIVVVSERLEEAGSYWITRDTERPAIPLMLTFTPRTAKPDLATPAPIAAVA
jgi:indole-3-acetate monooxygenase